MKTLRNLLLAIVVMTALAVATGAGIGIASQRPSASVMAVSAPVETAASSAVFCPDREGAEGHYLARDPGSSC
jgi:hypothetical protein